MTRRAVARRFAGAAGRLRDARAVTLGRRMSPRSRLLTAAVVTVVAVVMRISEPQPTVAVALIGALAATAVVVGGRSVAANTADPTWRRGWAILGLAVLAFAVSSALRVAAPDAGADAVIRGASLVGNAAGVAGLVALVRHRAPARAVGSTLEAAVVAACMGYVGWVLSTVSGAPADAMWLSTIALNAGCAWLAARLLLMASDRPLVLSLIAAGSAAKLAVNVVAFTVSVAARVESTRGLAWLQLWVLALWAFAAMHRSLARPFEVVRAREVSDVSARNAVFGSSVLMVLAVVGLQVLFGTDGRTDVVWIGGSVLPVALVLHMAYQLVDRSRAEHRAYYDGVTGLPNRAHFQDRLAGAVAQAAAGETSFAVVVLDLDRFKTVNDSLGHADGNLVLQAVAGRLANQVREPDVAARIGGDEFALLLHGVDDDLAEAAATAVLGCFKEPYAAGERHVFTSASVGIATYPTGGDTMQELLEHADTALHEAKARGRNRYECYRRDMSARATLRLALEANLLTSIDNGELALHFQPQVSIADGRLVGFEALARWRHPGVGFIAPGVFVPLAEECGFIHTMGAWAVRQVCRHLGEWQAAGLPVVPVAVNVSAHQVTDGRFADVVEAALAEFGVSGELLEVELTESVLVDDFAQVSALLDRLQQLGVRTAIDDFGTGYSGLRYLAQMPIDTLKIDRSFVSQLGADGADRGIVRAVIGLADTLGLDVVAEGVETKEQAAMLRDYGCARLQGFLVSGALPADRVPELLGQGAFLEWPAEQVADVVDLVVRQPASALTFSDPRVAAVLQAACRPETPGALDTDLTLAVIDALHEARGARAGRAAALVGKVAASGSAAALLPLIALPRPH